MIVPLAEMIYSHSLITGFEFNSKPHVINLFADNVILILTNSLTSLPHTHQVLTSFSSVSYYRVNFTKSLILDLGISQSTRSHLQNTGLYMWRTQGISYPGITLTAMSASLATSNLKNLIAKIEAQTRNIYHNISWPGRIAAIKMLILPQILYIF